MPTHHPRRLVRSAAAIVVAASLLIASAGDARATTASIAPDGNVLVDGTPFFPIGIYHVSWIGNRQGGKAVPDLLLAADAGFNLFHATIDTRADTQDLLDAAAARGVYVIGERPVGPWYQRHGAAARLQRRGRRRSRRPGPRRPRTRPPPAPRCRPIRRYRRWTWSPPRRT